MVAGVWASVDLSYRAVERTIGRFRGDDVRWRMGDSRCQVNKYRQGGERKEKAENNG